MYKSVSLQCIEEVCCSRTRNKTLLWVRKQAILLQLYTGGREHWHTWPTASRPQRRKRRKLSRMLSALVCPSTNVFLMTGMGVCWCEVFLSLHNESCAQSKQPVKTEGLWTLSLWFIVLSFSSQVKLTAEQRSEAVGLFRVSGVIGFVLSDDRMSATATLCHAVTLPFFSFKD